MTRRRRPAARPSARRMLATFAAAAALALAACDGEGDPPANAVDEGRAGPAFTLAGSGLGPGLAFGMAQDEAVAAATAALGAPTGRGHNDECGEGPMDFVSFGDLQLAFQRGRLAGWSLGGTRPRLRTAGGLTIGSPRAALGGAEIEPSSLGPEFRVDGVGGILDQQGRSVEALWAGSTCQFR